MVKEMTQTVLVFAATQTAIANRADIRAVAVSLKH
jgi:hypothetical protein